MVVNILHNLNLALTLALHEPKWHINHYIILRAVVYIRCTNGICIVVRLSVALASYPGSKREGKKEPDAYVGACAKLRHINHVELNE